MDLRHLSREEIRLMKPRTNLSTAFDKFEISDGQFLDSVGERQRCPKCGHSRMYYCYTCCRVLDCFEDRVPRVRLPFSVDILKHPKETSGKSTALHAPLLCPDQVSLHVFPDIPDYCNTAERVVLIFPDENSSNIDDVIEKNMALARSIGDSKGEPYDGNQKQFDGKEKPFDRVVLIDCTWNQVKSILLDSRVKDLARVEISSHNTLFWRYQTGKPSTFLATIEALYYTVLSVHRMSVHGQRTRSTAVQGTLSSVPCSQKRNFRPHARDIGLMRTGSKNCVFADANGSKNGVFADASGSKNGVFADANGSKKGPVAGPCGADGIDDRPCAANGSRGAGRGFAVADAVIESTTEEALKLESFDARFKAPRFDANAPHPNDCYERETKSDTLLHCEIGDHDNNMERTRDTSGPVASNDDSLFVDKCCHQFDNMLFFFKFMYFKIHGLYGSDNLRAYKYT